MDWHAKSVANVLAETGSAYGGLSEDEAHARLERYGPNELEREERPSALAMFLGQFKNVLIIILLVATVLSIVVGETVDAIIIGVIIVFSAGLGFVQEYRAERALEALKNMLRATVTIRRANRPMEIDARGVVPGDVLMLQAGDRVMADARVIESASLQCDEAPLTGESMPVEKVVEALAGNLVIADRKNMVYAGSIVTYGRAAAVVTETAMSTEFGKIAKEVAAVESEPSPLERRTEEIGKWLGIVSLIICAVVIVISLIREAMGGTVDMKHVVEMVMFGVALAVAAVPEALAAIVTGALAIGMREMAKRNALVRRMPAVETLGCTTVICTDKTGTLTKGEMTVRRLYAGGSYAEVTGAGYEPSGEFKAFQGSAPKKWAVDALLECGALCSDATLAMREGRWTIKGDPTEAAMIVAAEKGGMDYEQLREAHRRVAEVPFSSERKLMSTVNADANSSRVRAFVKGAPEEVLARSTHVLTETGPAPLDDAGRAAILRANEEMAGDALRVLALAFREMPAGGRYKMDEIEGGLVFLGLTGMMDPPRPEAVDAVAVCKRVHMRTVMITGDHKMTAVAVAREMGIYADGDMVLTGEELEAIDDTEFDRVVRRVSVYARVSPMDKLKIVKAWKRAGEVVAMTGDGVNDAPALKHADIGIAMGISGTEVAKEAADMVLADDNFATIVAAIERGRWIYDNIKKYLTYLLRCNITEVLVIGGVVVMLGPEHLPLLPAAILYVNLATDGLPALALGVAPPDPDIMRRPPRSPSESVFTREVLAFIAMAIIVELPVFLWMYFSALPDQELARTRMFFMFIVLELAISLNFRSMKYGLFKAPPHGWLLLAFFWELALIAVLIHLPVIRDSFGVAYPRALDLMEIGAFCVGIMVSMEALKYALRKRGEALAAVNQTI